MTTSPGVLSRPIFLLLPAELRNTIYGLIFWDTYKSIALNSQAEKTPDAEDLAILRVSRATTNEALAIFYTECTFKFHIDCGDDRFIMPSIEMTAKLKKVIFDVVGDGKYYLQRRQLQSAAEAFMDIRTIRDCMVVEVNMVEGIEYCNHDRLIHDALCELLSLRSLIIKFLLFKEPKQNQIWEESCIFLQRRIKRSLEEDLVRLSLFPVSSLVGSCET